MKAVLIWAICAILHGPSASDGDGQLRLLSDYFAALSKGQTLRLQCLLDSNFHYEFTENGKSEVLDRDSELAAVKAILNEGYVGSHSPIRTNPNYIHHKFTVAFGPSSFSLQSFFFGDVFFFDNDFQVDVQGDQILKIREITRSNKIPEVSFGHLKLIYSKDRYSKWESNNREDVIRLFDKSNQHLLMVKKMKQTENGREDIYLLPDGRRVGNIE